MSDSLSVFTNYVYLCLLHLIKWLGTGNYLSPGGGGGGEGRGGEGRIWG